MLGQIMSHLGKHGALATFLVISIRYQVGLLSNMSHSPQIFYKEPISPILYFGFHFEKLMFKCLILNTE